MWYVNIISQTTSSNHKGFILTMWYVNESVQGTVKLMEMCFILTMWYVNMETAFTKKPLCFSFILTMWYVNN